MEKKNYNSMDLEGMDGNTLYAEYLITGDKKLLHLSAEKGNVLAMRTMYKNLKSTDEDEATEWLAKAAQAGDKECMCTLAMKYLKDKSENAKYATAVSDFIRKLFDGTIMEEDYNACDLAELYFAAKDYERALKMYHKWEELNESLGLGPYKSDDLAIMYYEGLGCDVDYKKAAYYFNNNAARLQKLLSANNETIEPSIWERVADFCYRTKMEWKTDCACRRKDWGRIIELYEKLGYCRPWLLNDVAWAYCMTGNFNVALPLAQRALQVYTWPCVYDTLATALEGVGQFDKALSAFESCLQLYINKHKEAKISETEEKIRLLKEKMNNNK